MRVRPAYAILLILGVTASGPLAAQSAPQPAPQTATRSPIPTTIPDLAAKPAWQTFVNDFAAALSAPVDDDRVDAMISDEALVHRFGRSEREGLARLRDRAAGKESASGRAYLGTPAALATDLAADFRDANVSDSIKHLMVPANDADLKRANQTSAEWVSTTINPSPNDLVGVIVFVSTDSAAEHSAGEAVVPPLFVLFKGEPAGAGQFRAKLIVYGDPRQ